MFKIIKSSIYDKFHCLMSACPANCCDEPWNIIIDDAAYNRLCQMGVEDIDSKITKETPHLLIKNDGKCPFITDEGLCRIHANYGEDYISETCRSYPRFASKYNDIYTQTLGLSCPEVSRLFLELNCNIEFKSEYHYEDKSEVGKKFKPLESELILNRIFNQFKGKANVFDAFKALEKAYGKDDIFDIDVNNIMDALNVVLKELNSPIELTACTKEELTTKAEELANKYPYFLVNLCRYYFFERIMQLEASINKDVLEVIKKAKIFLLIVLNALDTEDVATSLYMITRAIDHSEHVIDAVKEAIKK